MQNDTTNTTRSVARAYFEGWTAHRYEDAVALLANDLTVEVPVNSYPDRASFAHALSTFGAMIERVDLLSSLADANEAMVLYDMHVVGLGAIRVAEHLTVSDGRITRVRQIHDTVAIRAAGFASEA
jgi:ketosteroid isomerase-like protein